MVAEDTTVYLTFGCVFSLCAFGIGVFALRESGRARRMGLVGAVPAVSIAATYLLMGLNVGMVETAGRDQSVVRFIGYTAALTAFGYLLMKTVFLPRRKAIVVTTAIVLTPWVSFVSWFLTGTVESLVTLASLLIFGYATYLLYGPLNTFAAMEGGKRELLYAKLRNLFVIGYGTLVLLSATSEQVLGLLTTFVATVAAGYADGVVMLGIGLLVLSSLSVFRDAETGDSHSMNTTAAVEPSD